MPNQRLKSIVSDQINAHLDEIDELNRATYAEQLAEKENYVPKQPGYFSTTPGNLQAMGVGLLLVLLGFLFGVYLMAMLGGAIVVLVINQSGATPPEPPADPEPPTPARERWEWSP